MKTTKMTIKEIVDTIPARLGISPEQLDLSTPQKAFDFLTNEDFQIFARSANNVNIWDGENCSMVHLETGYKSMHDVNNLFAENSEKRDELYKKYGISESWIADFSVDDETGFVEWASWAEDEVHIIEDNKWPYILGFDGFGCFDEFVDVVKRICINNNEWAKITAYISDKEYVIRISESGTITNDSIFEILDDNSYYFAHDLAHYLEVYMCDTFEDMEKFCPKINYVECSDKIDLPKYSGFAYTYFHKDELENETNVDKAIEIIKKYPCAITALSEEVQKNEKVGEAFVEANAVYVQEYLDIQEELFYSRQKTDSVVDLNCKLANVYLNGVVVTYFSPLKNNVLHSWIVTNWYKNDIKMIEKMVEAKMHSWVVLNDDLFTKLDHIELLKKYPWYVYTLVSYFFKEFSEGKKVKLREHIKRRFNLMDNIEDDNLAIMATYEMACDLGSDVLVELAVFHSFVLADYIKELFKMLPKETRNLIIKHNMKLMFYIADELDSDDDIVDYICENCPKAGDILSDEIVIKRGLKRSVMNIDDICTGCFLC